MNNSLKKIKVLFIITFALIILMIFTNTINAENTYQDTTSSKNNDIVYFQKPTDWGENETPYIYAWDSYDAYPANKLGGSFPGVQMTKVNDNLYMYKFDSDVNYIKLIFSNGTSSKQTQDLDYICNGYTYGFDNKENLAFSPEYLYSGDVVSFEKPDSWNDTIYIYMWNTTTTNSNSNWHTRTMTKVDGNLYSYTISSEDWNVSDGYNYVIFSDESHQTVDLITVFDDAVFKANSSAIDSGADYGKYSGSWVYGPSHIDELESITNQYVVPAEDVSYYTEDSYAAYDEQYNLAGDVINAPAVAISYYDHTKKKKKSKLAVPNVYNNLKINTQILADKINEMKNVDTTKYDPDLVQAFNDAIDDAETVLADVDNITIQKMKDSILDMEEAYDNLKVDKTDLETLLNQAKNIDKSLYTDETANNLTNAINAATAVLEDNDAGYQDVTEQIEKLNNAISSLVKKQAEEDNSTDPEEDDGTTTTKPSKKNDETTTDPADDNKKKAEEDTSTKEKDSEKKSVFGNPGTGDNILIFVAIFLIAAGVFVYVKKH